MNIRRSYIAALHDTIMAAISFVAALYLRLGDEFVYTYTLGGEHPPFLFAGTLIFTSICMIVFSTMRLYRGIWRYASVPDLIAITKSVTLSILIFVPVLFMVTRLEGMPRSSLFINWLLLLVLLSAPRLLYRSLKDRHFGLDFNSSAVDKRIPVILAGINDNAELFLRETRGKNSSAYRVVGIIDHDKNRIGRYLHSIKIYGDFTVIPKIVEKLRKKGKSPQKILITDEHPDTSHIKHLLTTADSLGLTLARIPRLSELKNTSAGNKLELRPIAIEDLLGRAQKALDRNKVQTLVAGKRVLVTGAGGTIGSELVRQIVSYKPASIILADHAEFNLYQIDHELKCHFLDITRFARIVDVRNLTQLEAIFSEYNPELVFHAAAIKHVPIAEENPIETVETNVIGTRNVADCCLKYAVTTMVMISTDKAVNPTSIMGTTKRAAESYCQALGNGLVNQTTHFTTVRFGNVLGSSGSVIPLFQKQLEAGGPLTVTHPEMERYFMTVREAVELVLQASALGMEERQKSSIFVLDMGEPIKIADLAVQMIRMAGLRPDIDIAIRFTGLRPGEKLFEELFYTEEELKNTAISGIMLASPRHIHYEHIKKVIDALYNACKHYNRETAIELLQQLVPEYKCEAVHENANHRIPVGA